MKYLIAALFSLFMLPALAQTVTIDLGKLPEEVKQQVQKANEVAQQAQQAATNAASTVTPEKVAGVMDTMLSRMEQFGKVAATGITSFAKEMGIAAADFATTPLGMLLVVVLIMNYAGGAIIEFAIGSVFLFIVLPIVSWKTYKLFIPRVIVDKWEAVPVLWGLFTRRVAVETHEDTAVANDGESGSMMAMIGVFATLLTLVIGLTTFIPG